MLQITHCMHPCLTWLILYVWLGKLQLLIVLHLLFNDTVLISTPGVLFLLLPGYGIRFLVLLLNHLIFRSSNLVLIPFWLIIRDGNNNNIYLVNKQTQWRVSQWFENKATVEKYDVTKLLCTAFWLLLESSSGDLVWSASAVRFVGGMLDSVTVSGPTYHGISDLTFRSCRPERVQWPSSDLAFSPYTVLYAVLCSLSALVHLIMT